MKLDPADRVFSKYIRTRDKWTCQRCHRKHEENSQGLHNSHYYGRSRENTRFDPRNCIALCYGCHRIWGSDDREGYRQYMINRLGIDDYNSLQVAAETYKKKDRKMELIIARELLKSLG